MSALTTKGTGQALCSSAQLQRYPGDDQRGSAVPGIAKRAYGVRRVEITISGGDQSGKAVATDRRTVRQTDAVDPGLIKFPL
jgi:hypothetical protein